MRLRLRILSTSPRSWPACLRPFVWKSTNPGLRAELDRAGAPASSATVIFSNAPRARQLEPAR